MYFTLLYPGDKVLPITRSSSLRQKVTKPSHYQNLAPHLKCGVVAPEDTVNSLSSLKHLYNFNYKRRI